MLSSILSDRNYKKVVITTPDEDTFNEAQDFLISHGFRLPGRGLAGEGRLNYKEIVFQPSDLGLVVFPAGIDNATDIFMYTSVKQNSLSIQNSIEVTLSELLLEEGCLDGLPLAVL